MSRGDDSMPEWSVRLAWAGPMTDDLADELATRLEDVHAAPGTTPGGLAQVRLTIEAPTATMGLDVVYSRLWGTIGNHPEYQIIEIMPQADFLRREAELARGGFVS